MDGAGHVKKAKEKAAKAESALKKFSFFSNSQTKYEDAAEAFGDAGKLYLMGKAFPQAADVYEKSADYYLKAKSEFDAATARVKAAEAAQKMGSADRCAYNYKQAIHLYAGLGKSAMAAGAAKKCAELLESENEPTAQAQAIEIYKEAIDLYDAENRPQAANSAREKVATLSAAIGSYEEASAAFEDLGKQALQTNLGKFNAKKWFTNSVLCALARDDSVKARNKLLEFGSLDYSFDASTRDHQLCTALVEAVDNHDPDAIAQAAADYDKVKKLDPWMTKVLLAIKATIHEDELQGGAAPPDDDDAEDLPDLT